MKIRPYTRFSLRPTRLALAAAVALGTVTPLLMPQSVQAGAYIMSASDALNATSFNTIGKWVTDPGAVAATGAPSAGNTYITGAYVLRTPTANGTYTFGGDSLSIDAGGTLLGKATTITLNFTNGTGLFLNGGLLRTASGTNNTVLTAAGTITANDSTTSFLSAQGGANLETLDVTGSIGGPGNLTINGKVNATTFTDSGVVKLSGANTINGMVTVTTPTTGTITSATNRLLQLNNDNALQNATLSLTGGGAANLVSFTTVAGTYNIGALAGGANQVLNNTDGTGITLNVGGNGGSANYTGILSGAGALTKSGAGTMTLSGPNTYTGNTFISAGMIALGNALALQNSAFDTASVNGGLDVTGYATPTLGGLTGSVDLSPTLITGYGSVTGLTLNPQNGVTQTYSGIISSGSGAMTLTKTGAGTQVLSGPNTYGGTTTVSAGTLKIASGGSFTTTNAANTNSLLVGGAAGNSLLHIQSGGAGTVSRLQIGTVNNGNGAIYNQGTFTVNGTANLGNFALGYATGAYGYYRHDTVTTTTVAEVGIGATSASITANLGGNGVMDVLQGKVANTGWFSLNRGNTTQYGQLNISGGTFELPNQANQVGLFMNNADTQNNKGGHAVINVSGTGSLTSAGTATELDLMRISQPTTATTMLGVLNIGSGGTVQTNKIKATQANGTALVNFHGGTLKANNTGVTLMGGSNIDGAYIYSGGAIVNTNGKDVTVSQNLLAPSGDGVATIPVTANGTGYIGRPVVYLTGGGGTGATAVADFNPATGEVTGITVTNPGTGYTTAPTVTIAGGGGTAPTLGTVTLAPNASGGLTKSAAGTLTLSGSNTYTGNTTVSGGTLVLTSTGKLKFTPTSNGTTNSVGGTGSVTIDGKFVVDLTVATVANGNSWTLLNTGTLAESFNLTTFGIETTAAVPFTDPDNDKVWTLVDGANTWSFKESDGTLSVAIAGYTSWAAANGATGQPADQDHDNDGVMNGVEYFMGESGSTFTANPGIVSGAVTWPMAASYTGAYGTDYVIETSGDLVNWAPASIGAGAGFVSITPATSVTYTLPTGDPALFVRLVVTPD